MVKEVARLVAFIIISLMFIAAILVVEPQLAIRMQEPQEAILMVATIRVEQLVLAMFIAELLVATLMVASFRVEELVPNIKAEELVASTRVEQLVAKTKVEVELVASIKAKHAVEELLSMARIPDFFYQVRNINTPGT